jgi:chorismate synthase
MSFNSLGKLFTVTTFGESHGEAIGAVIDGCPSNILIDMDYIQKQLDRRRPGQSDISSPRRESDQFRIISGLFEGKTTGAPITILIENKDVKSADYDEIKKFYRPSHADFVYHQKYGHYDYRGGGRSSARTTASLVAAGAIAQQLLLKKAVYIQSYVSDIGEIGISKKKDELDLTLIESNSIRCPDPEAAALMEELILQTKEKGDTIGGMISCIIKGCPIGLGEPMFDKLHADLGKAMFSINAVKGVEFGDGFEGARSFGSLQNDAFIKTGEEWNTKSNHSGGIQGGISNGMDIFFRLAFKPVSTLMQAQTTSTREGSQEVLEPRGRHDVCVVPRAVPIVDAMASIIILNHLLMRDSHHGF